MNNTILEIISLLNGTADDIDKIENKKYGYKSSAVRARRACQEAIVQLKQLRKDIQSTKKEAEEE
jgi:hypothetical protein